MAPVFFVVGSGPAVAEVLDLVCGLGY